MADELQNVNEASTDAKGQETNPPTVTQVNNAPVAGGPSVPSLAIGYLKNTTIDEMNNSLAHSCDFVSELKHNNALKEWINSNSNTIREGVRAVMKALGLSDATGQYQWLTSKLKAITRALKYIQNKIIQPIIDFEKLIVQYINKLKEIVAWIASLPAKLTALLADCTKRLLKLIAGVFSDFLSNATDAGAGDAIAAAKEAVATTFQTVNKAATAAAGAAALATVAQSVPALVTPNKSRP